MRRKAHSKEGYEGVAVQRNAVVPVDELREPPDGRRRLFGCPVAHGAHDGKRQRVEYFTPRNYDNPALHFLNHRRAFVTDEAAGEGSATIGSASTALVPWDYNTESFSNHKNPTDIQL